jgi:hypothetical protein
MYRSQFLALIIALCLLKCAEGRATEEHLFVCCAFFVVLITVAAASQEC